MEELIWLRGFEAGVQQMREDGRSLPAALDTVIAEVEAMPKEQINRAMEPVGPRGPMGYRTVVLKLLRALRAEHSAGEGEDG